MKQIHLAEAKVERFQSEGEVSSKKFLSPSGLREEKKKQLLPVAATFLSKFVTAKK